MKTNNKKKLDQLGMHHATASSILKKNIMFSLLKETKRNFCYQCSSEIETVDELSVEHKVPYLDSHNPRELFFDLSNIAFSHLKCNIKAIRRKKCEHGSLNKYKQGCRCSLCKIANRDMARRHRERKLNNGSMV